MRKGMDRPRLSNKLKQEKTTDRYFESQSSVLSRKGPRKIMNLS